MNSITSLFNKIEEINLWEKELTLTRNEYLKVKGSVDTNLYFVVSGTLRIYVLDEFEEHTIRFGYQNNFIAALDSFISEKPSDLYIQALKEVKLKVINKKDYLAFIKSSEENRMLWEIILQQLVYQQMERERDVLTTSPLERYKRVLKRTFCYPDSLPHQRVWEI